MGGRERGRPSNSGSVPPRRRKSLLHRITDTITSFLPSLFETREESESATSDSDVEIVQHVAKRPRTAQSRETSPQASTSSAPIRHSVSRITEIEIPAVAPKTSAVVDVDLDAADDASDFSSGSKASVTTSGVSSLLPRDHRNDPPVVKPSPTDFRSQYMTQVNTSNTIKRGPLELWTDYDISKQNDLDVSTPSRVKRLRAESSSNMASSYTSPFYRGRVSYGGAASVRSTAFARSVFEQVEPLKFIMDTKEEKPKNAPPSSTVLQSATAQRILQNLERHASISPSKGQTVVPISNPFSALSRPLQRTTTRYPAYMAAYNRYKELRRHSSAQSTGLPSEPQPSPSTPVATSSQQDKNEPLRSAVSTSSSSWTSQKPPDTPFPSTSQSTLPSQTRIGFGFSPSQKPQKPVLEPSSSFNKPELPTRSTLQTSDSSSKPPVRIESPILPTNKPEVAKEDPSFVFSKPIALTAPSKPLVPTVGVKFSFSKPVSHLKRTAAQNVDSKTPEDTTQDPPPPNKVVKPSAPPVNLSGDDRPPTKSLSLTDAKAWDCPTCLVKNKAELPKCVCCQTPNPTSKVNLDAHSGGSTPVFKFGAPKPVSATNDAASSTPASQIQNSASSTGFTFGKANGSPESCLFKFGKPVSVLSGSTNSGKWDCPTCLVKNDDSVEKCPCCSTAKPGDSANTLAKSSSSQSNFIFGKANASAASAVSQEKSETNRPSFVFGNAAASSGRSVCQTNATTTPPTFVFDKPTLSASSAGKWDCPTCLVKNDDGVANCPCCKTAKPGGKSVPASGFVFGSANAAASAEPKNGSDSQSESAPSQSLFVFGESAASSNKWNCPTCLVRNDDSLANCPCCNTSKPGSKDANQPSSQPSFVFGRPSSAAPSQPPGFTFGKPASTATSQASNDAGAKTLVFGAPSASTSNALNPPAFVFGSPATASNTTTTSQPSFVFGAPKTTSVPSSSGADPKPLGAGTWDCPTCMVKNKSDVSSCPCCQTAKPGADKTPQTSATVAFGSPSSPGFPDSPPVIISSIKPTSSSATVAPPPVFKFGEYTKTISSFAGSTSTPSFAFSSTNEPSTSQSGFRLGFKPATFAPPVRPLPSSSLKINGGFQFSAPAAAAAAPSPVSFDFAAKKENLTPASAAPESGTTSPAPMTFNFGAAPQPVASSSSSPVAFKFGASNSNSSASAADTNNNSASTNLFSSPSASPGHTITGVNGRIIRRAVRRLNKN